MKKSKITHQKERPLCILCHIRLCKKNGISTNGFQKYEKYCHHCGKIVYNTRVGHNGRGRKYALHKKQNCERCGFIPIHLCQLDVDHIDGNRNNDDPINLQTLCANCHRLETYNKKVRLYEADSSC